MKRYAVECLGRVLTEHDELIDAAAACGGVVATDERDDAPHVRDRKTGLVVTARRLHMLYRSRRPRRGAR